MADNFNTLDRADGIQVSPDDTTPDLLDQKIVAGTNITLNTLNPGGDEQLEIVAAGGGGGGFSGALVSRSSTQSVSGSVDTIVNWNDEIYDTDTFHDTVTNNSRITIPAGVSRVRLYASCQFSIATGVDCSIFIIKNGEALGGNAPNYIGAGAFIGIDAGSGGVRNPSYYCSTAIIDVVQNDYFEAVVGADAAFNVQAGGTKTYFGIEVIE